MHDDVQRLVDDALRGTLTESQLTEKFWDDVKNRLGSVKDRAVATVAPTNTMRNNATADYKLRAVSDQLYQGWVKWSRGAGGKPATLANLTQFLKVEGIPQPLISKYYADSGFTKSDDAADAKDDRQGEFDFNAPKQPTKPSDKDPRQGELNLDGPKKPTGGTPAKVSPEAQKKIIATLPTKDREALAKMTPEQQAAHVARLVKLAHQKA